MATITARLIARTGLEQDLPMSPGNYLQPGEFAYATDTGRTFVGNQPLPRVGDGIVTTFSFNQIDLESVQGTFRIWLFADDLDTVGTEQLNNVHYTLSNETVTFFTPPAVDEIVRLYHNTELLVSKPDRQYGHAEQRELAPVTSPESTGIDIAISLPDPDNNLVTLFDTINIDYVLYTSTGERRNGILRIAVDADSSTYTMDDNYTTNTVGSAMDITFSCVIAGNYLTLMYDDATFTTNMSYVVRNWNTRTAQLNA
jgi:hypothetical protein